MENCSFKPKINSDTYLKKRKIKRNTKFSALPSQHGEENSPSTPNGLKRQPFGRRIGSKEYLELEFVDEEQEIQNFSTNHSKMIQTPTRPKKKAKRAKKSKKRAVR